MRAERPPIREYVVVHASEKGEDRVRSEERKSQKSVHKVNDVMIASNFKL